MAMERCDIYCGPEPKNNFRQYLLSLVRISASRIRRRVQLADQHRQLREMDEHMLKDIGLSRADVERIAGRRWFWEDPVATDPRVDQRYRSADKK